MRDYIWFCLEHIRDYNKSWNFYAGMDEAEIERQIRDDVTWQRPTWPLGARGGASGPEIHDDFDVFDDAAEAANERHGASGYANGLGRAPQPEREAFAAMELTPPVSREQVRVRYKELVKRLHPDANGGDKQAEERLKSVTQAYATLKSSQYVR